STRETLAADYQEIGELARVVGADAPTPWQRRRARLGAVLLVLATPVPSLLNRPGPIGRPRPGPLLTPPGVARHAAGVGAVAGPPGPASSATTSSPSTASPTSRTSTSSVSAASSR